MCIIRKRLFIYPRKVKDMTKRKASEIKPGDRINGIAVFDTLRKTFGGFYLPMEDGTRIEVATADTLIFTE